MILLEIRPNPVFLMYLDFLPLLLNITWRSKARGFVRITCEAEERVCCMRLVPDSF